MVRIFINAIIMFAVLFAATLRGQIRVSVGTDKTIYRQGENIEIFIIADNPADSAITLNFSSSCQASYSIDTFTPIFGCLTILTSQTIPAKSAFTWSHIHAFSRYPLSSGFHTIRGEVIGYGFSAPIVVRIDPAVKVVEELKTARTFILHRNFPNPFNPSTVIRYTIPQDAEVTLKIYDVEGREIDRPINAKQPAGEHNVRWAPSNSAGGIYLYRLQAGRLVATGKMVQLR